MPDGEHKRIVEAHKHTGTPQQEERHAMQQLINQHMPTRHALEANTSRARSPITYLMCVLKRHTLSDTPDERTPNFPQWLDQTIQDINIASHDVPIDQDQLGSTHAKSNHNARYGALRYGTANINTSPHHNPT